MEIHSALPKRAYLQALRESTDNSVFHFGVERFTGFIVGKWFYITHHAGFEWNRRYTNQKNAAFGYVCETGDGCRIRFIRFKGALCPGQFLFIWLLVVVGMVLTMLAEGVSSFDTVAVVLGICTGATFVGALLETFFESLTERSEEGRRCLLAHLIDPSDPFSYLNHRNEIY